MWISRLAQENLLPWRQFCRGRWRNAFCCPRHMGNTIFVEQSAALMLAPPGCRPVSQRLGKEHDGARRRLRDDHTGHLFGVFSDLLGQLVMALVAAGDTTKSA